MSFEKRPGFAATQKFPEIVVAITDLPELGPEGSILASGALAPFFSALKTVNGESLLGSGNLTVAAGSALTPGPGFQVVGSELRHNIASLTLA